MHDVIPGILENDWAEIERKLAIIKPFSKKVHIDILDGKFSEETSFSDPKAFEKYKDDFFMEAHLMVEEPSTFVKPFAESGFNRFIGHIEKMKDLEEFIALGQIYGEVGVALDLDTPVDSLNVPYDDLDFILLMSVKAGKSGQEFSEEVLFKIKKIREKSQIPIEIDGGINDLTLPRAKKEGAQRFVATSFIFGSQDPIKAYETLLAID